MAHPLQPDATVLPGATPPDADARHLDRATKPDDAPQTVPDRPLPPTGPSARARAIARVAGVLLSLAATTYVFLVLNRPFFNAISGYDEEFFVWLGWCVRKGLAPYRDFTELKPPVLFLTHALAQTTFGVANFGYRTFFAVFPLLSLLAFQIALLARRVSGLFAAAVVIGIVTLFMERTWHDTALSDSESIGLSYYLLGLACFLWEGRRIKVTTTLGGFFLGCCVMSKEPFLAPALTTWLGLFWLRRSPAPPRERRVLLAKYSLLGVGILIFGLAAYMVPTGAMKAYVKQAIGYVTIHRDARTSYCAANGGAQSRTLADTWKVVQSVFVNERELGYLVPLLAPGLVFVWRRSRVLFAFVVLTFIAGLMAATASNCRWLHYYTMAMTGVIFALAVAVDTLAPLLAARVPSLRLHLGIAALLLVAVHANGDVYRARVGNYVREPWQPAAPDLMTFIAEHTTAADRIFTTGTPMLYVQANRLSAVRESSIIDDVLGAYPGQTDEEKLRPLRDELERTRPKVVFLDPGLFEKRRSRHLATLVMPYLEQFGYEQISDRLYFRP